MASEVTIRPADPDDRLAVARLFDAAMLETDDDRLRRQLRETDGFVLLATIDTTPVGAIALDASAAIDSKPAGGDADPVRITAIAVRRRRRDRGIGRRLVAAAAERVALHPLTAVFDEGVRPFYLACGFEIEPHDGRLWGIRRPDATA
ncbi:GNAT family N-acetyltransferase [Halonotius terrestris]|uniref:GNAT family N-acetyltransferase n=1 Tax=Halonotius terrestris TaxID=2487750 RepID=A0A8J8TCF2_9EURY|nr:GNAT family N-acetyltransferase [Halonotius terrestris]TQQ83468.1 GNAT family N-acetyltransferase [Halonotius terrestris]